MISVLRLGFVGLTTATRFSEKGFKVYKYEIDITIKNSKIIFIYVGTPSDENGIADLSYIKSVIVSILKIISKENKKTNVIKSTIPLQLKI